MNYIKSITDGEFLAQHQGVIEARRRLAASQEYEGPIMWEVPEGLSVQDLSQHGPCYENNRELVRTWSLADQCLEAGIFFWIPRPLCGSFGLSLADQQRFLDERRQIYGLPATDLACFGPAGVLFGLILAHYRETGEKLLQNSFCCRTDTFDFERARVNVGPFVEHGTVIAGGLACIPLHDTIARPEYGVFAFGRGSR